MRILGSIDNASYKSPDGQKAVCHIIITSEKLVVARVLDRHQEVMDHPVRGSNFGGGARGSYIAAKALQIQMIDDALKRGKEIENNLEEYLNSNPEGLKTLQYNDVTKAVLSKGNPFSLPSLVIYTDEDKLDFKLIRENFEGTGKLKPETFKSYSDSLQQVLGDKLNVK